MNKTLSSILKVYSIGIVVVNKPVDTDVIEVFPTEHLTDMTAELDVKDTKNGLSEDIDGIISSFNVDKTSIIRARWLALGNSNRVTSPDVKRGETVLIYRFGDTDEYYWENIFTETDLRGTEDVTYVFGNTDVFKEEFNLENTYWLNISTKNKNVQFHISDNNGEYTKYDLQFNTKDGIVTFKDGKDNMVELDSKLDKLTININKLVEVNTTDVLVNAENSVEVNTATANITASESATLTTGKCTIISDECAINP